MGMFNLHPSFLNGLKLLLKHNSPNNTFLTVVKLMIMINLLGFLGMRIVFHAHILPFLETGFSPYASIKDRRKDEQQTCWFNSNIYLKDCFTFLDNNLSKSGML
jgi:hypothetical protein